MTQSHNCNTVCSRYLVRWCAALTASIEAFQASKLERIKAAGQSHREHMARKAQKALEEKGEMVGTQALKLLWRA